MISIGALSKATGVAIETIRFYEREGVLPRPQRAPNGRRLYSDGDVQRLRFVRNTRALGFDLNSVRSLLALQCRAPSSPCDRAKEIASEHLRLIDQRIERLLSAREELRRMCDECPDEGIANCEVLCTVAH